MKRTCSCAFCEVVNKRHVRGTITYVDFVSFFFSKWKKQIPKGIWGKNHKNNLLLSRTVFTSRFVPEFSTLPRIDYDGVTYLRFTTIREDCERREFNSLGPFDVTVSSLINRIRAPHTRSRIRRYIPVRLFPIRATLKPIRSFPTVSNTCFSLDP